MKTKLDELLEKWREQSKYYKEHDSSQSTSLIIDGCILELEAIKDSLNYPVECGDPWHNKPTDQPDWRCPTCYPTEPSPNIFSHDPVDEPSTEPLPSKDKRLWLTEHEKFLEAWMDLATRMLLNLDAETEDNTMLRNAFNQYRKSIGKP